MPSKLSEQIAALRKERGLTQEQLGNMVGVSSQAVSKWEKGGTPDVELLPVLSRQLGVTIDALFGMQGGEQEDPADAVGRWLRGFPAGERLNQFCRLVWRSIGHFAPGDFVLPDMSYPESCKLDCGDGSSQLFLSQVLGEGGILLDVHGSDLSFVTLWPKPEGGWAQWLAPMEEYRKLFAVLAKPGCLELLGYLYRRSIGWFSPGVVVKDLTMPKETAVELLEALTEREMLSSMELELEDGKATVYTVKEPLKLIPFLLLGRTLMQWDSNVMRFGDAAPVLAPDEVWVETGKDVPDGRHNA